MANASVKRASDGVRVGEVTVSIASRFRAVFIPHSSMSRAYRAEQFREAFAVPPTLNNGAAPPSGGTAKL